VSLYLIKFQKSAILIVIAHSIALTVLMSAADLASPAGFLVHYNIVILTYPFTVT